ncbi:sensor histidine kinase [Rubritalea sp.]|uniref:sensor histidine kinase n=1 Tax=Rubritalea sp. TaxID=2109375 RepID=UPI003EF76208
MKPNRTMIIWAPLAICALAVITGMGWLTYRSIEHQKISARAKADQLYAEARADIEERTRLSLWRLDAYAAGLLLAENQIPVDSYLSTRIDGIYQSAIQCRFEVNGSSQITVGASNLPAGINAQEQLIAALPTQISFCTSAHTSPPQKATEESIPTAWKSGSKYEVDNYQVAQNVNEKTARSKAFQTNNSIAVDNSQKLQVRQADSAFAPNSISPFESLWHNHELFLWRSIRYANKQANQGAWLDHQALSTAMLSEIKELLPKAELTPTSPQLKAENPLALVSLPFLLVTNETTPHISELSTQLDTSLWIAWAGALVALVAGAILIRGILRLSARRASFVSAVTHELRTPLTTFKLYTDILQNKAHKPEKSGEYLKVLSRESDRLTHLVENVLIFSQIERGSASAQLVTGDALELVSPMRPRFRERLDSAGLELQTHYPAAFTPSIDTSKLEHILFNLIDNAAKYAPSSEPPHVHLELKESKNTWQITVRDHGPGIPKAERKKIFQAFHKSADKAAETQPGVGLGLALSLRLAQSMQSKLSYQDSPDGGSSFTLEIPR